MIPFTYRYLTSTHCQLNIFFFILINFFLIFCDFTENGNAKQKIIKTLLYFSILYNVMFFFLFFGVQISSFLHSFSFSVENQLFTNFLPRIFQLFTLQSLRLRKAELVERLKTRSSIVEAVTSPVKLQSRKIEK